MAGVERVDSARSLSRVGPYACRCAQETMNFRRIRLPTESFGAQILQLSSWLDFK